MADANADNDNGNDKRRQAHFYFTKWAKRLVLILNSWKSSH